jgi:hypothetical protein
MRVDPRAGAGALLASAVALSFVGCGGGDEANTQGSSASTVPGYVSEPFSHQQQLIEQGARLVVSDGCAACHLGARPATVAPSFASFAGHRMMLTDGRSVVVDERFVTQALLHPGKTSIRGYEAASMLAATRRLDLPKHPDQVAALAAFIEQIGPEPG